MLRTWKRKFTGAGPSTLLRDALAVFARIRDRHTRPVGLDVPAGTRVLVLAPHPDDEVFGCGGTIHKHHLAGGRVTVAYLTDGGKGGPEGACEDRLAAERRNEAERAAAILGVDRLEFFENRDLELRPDSRNVERAARLLETERPDAVFVPFLLDHHPDHRAASRILVAAAGRHHDFTCWGYEVWTPLVPECFVDVTDVIEVKRQALAQFETQTRRFDLVGASLGLARYRSFTVCEGERYVECFFRCDPAAYRRLWKAAGW